MDIRYPVLHTQFKERRVVPVSVPMQCCFIMVWATISFHEAIDLIIIVGQYNSTETSRNRKNTFNAMLEGQQWNIEQDNTTIYTEQRVEQWLAV